MARKLLSNSRFINIKNPQLSVPQSSVTAVNIRREEVEDIRKRKGIPIRVLENKINLSKSRYYRWLQYQVDLPTELLMGLKKLLNMSDWEILSLFSSSTDEQIQILNLIIHTASSDEEFANFLLLKQKLEKYRVAGDDNLSYKLVLAYADAVENCYEGKDSKAPLESIEKYFVKIDYYTMFDILLYLATVNLKTSYGIKETCMEKEILLLEKSILRKLNDDNLQEWKEVLIGCVMDLSAYYYEKGFEEQAVNVIEQASYLLSKNQHMTTYTKEIFSLASSLFRQTELVDDKDNIQSFREKFASASWCLPQSELNFFEGLMS